MTIRSFVLVEPFGPLDIAIFDDNKQADTYTAGLREQGKDYRLIQSTGTVQDVRSHQRQLRADYVQRLTCKTAAAAAVSS